MDLVLVFLICRGDWEVSTASKFLRRTDRPIWARKQKAPNEFADGGDIFDGHQTFTGVNLGE